MPLQVAQTAHGEILCVVCLQFICDTKLLQATQPFSGLSTKWWAYLQLS